MLAREVEYNFNFMKYSEELTKAMDFLGKDPRTLFLGQAVEYPGTAMSNTLKNIPKKTLRTSCCRRDATWNYKWACIKQLCSS